MTPNVASAGSTPPKVETKNYNWVAPSWLVYIYIYMQASALHILKLKRYRED